MEKPDYLKYYEQQLKILEGQGFIIGDERFKYLRSLSMLLMHLHDAIMSMILFEKYSKADENEPLEEHVIEQALFRNAVLNYAKCFSQSGKGRMSLDKNDVYKDVTKFIPVHQQLMDFRNNFFAHSDDSGLDDVTFATKEESDRIFVKQLYIIAIPIDEFPKYLATFKYCGDYIKSKIEKNFKNIETKCGKAVYGFELN